MGLVSPGLTGGLLGGVAADINRACPDRITVQRGVRTVGTMGGTAYDFTTPTIIATNTPANIQEASPRETQEFARRGLSISHRIFTATDTTAALGDRIPDPNDAARFYTVVFVTDMGGMHAAFKIFANLVV
jgi:hypothetical protein